MYPLYFPYIPKSSLELRHKIEIMAEKFTKKSDSYEPDFYHYYSSSKLHIVCIITEGAQGSALSLA
jgi:hypothetical protein